METEESVQEATLSESGGVGGGGGESSAVSAAEPVAPAAETAEPVQAVSAESTAVPAEAFPGVDSFDWDNWDGSDYEAFPEQIRPWVDKLGDKYTKHLDSTTSQHTSELDYWKRMYEAMSYGEEDPRVSELSTQLEELTSKNTEMQDKYSQMEKVLNEEREAENTRYFTWFEKNYQGKLEGLAKTYGAKAAEEMVLGLMDLGMEVHVAVEVSLMGKEAIQTAKNLSGQVQDSSLVLEILRNRFKGEAPRPAPAAPAPKQAPNPATQVVAGSAPVSRPAQLSREKAPEYGSDRSNRMGALMAAAENAIKKSKRR